MQQKSVNTFSWVTQELHVLSSNIKFFTDASVLHFKLFMKENKNSSRAQTYESIDLYDEDLINWLQTTLLNYYCLFFNSLAEQSIPTTNWAGLNKA